MNKIKAEILKKVSTKDALGIATESFESLGEFMCNYIMPVSPGKSMVESYGFDEKTTHQTITRKKIDVNSYIRSNGRIFYCQYVAEYPKHYVLYLELMA